MCEHGNTLEDIHEGSIVCTDCGVVQDQIYVFRGPNQYASNAAHTNVHNNNPLDDEVSELMFKLQVDGDLCIKCSKLFREYKSQKPQVPEPYARAVAIYNSLKLEGVYRPVENIELVCNVKRNLFWRYVGMFEQTRSYDIQEKTEFLLSPLNLNFSESSEISELAQKLSLDRSFSTKTVIGAVAFLYLKSRGNEELTIKDFSELTQINLTSLAKCSECIKSSKWTITRALEFNRVEASGRC